MKRTYFIGTSCKYANMTVLNDDIKEVGIDEFYEILNLSIIKFDAIEFEKEAKKIKNLKKGVSIGTNYFKII